MKRKQKIFLLLFDLAIFVSVVYLMTILRGESVEAMKVFTAFGLWFIGAVVVILFYIFGAYDVDHMTSLRRMQARSLIALTVGVVVVVAVNYLVAKDRTGIFGRGILVGSFALFGAISCSYRAVIVSIVHRSFRRAKWLFVCSGTLFEQILRDLKDNRFEGQTAFLIDQTGSRHPDIIGDWTQLDGTLRDSWSTIVVAVEESAPSVLLERLMYARFHHVKIRDLIQFYEDIWHKVPLYYLGSRWFLFTEGFHLLGNPVRLRLKRLMDVLVSAGLLLLTWPLMLITWLLVRLDSPGPAIYKQVRTGKDGQDFVIYKFRSMRVDAEKQGAQWAAHNDSRVTRMGNFIRKTRIDELPQLFNILNGSMSFVGPRPERPEFNVGLSGQLPFYNMRHLVHPGLTGWAQILYPYGASVEDAKQKLQYDLYYIKNYSLWMDISVILKTVQVVLFGRGR